MGFRIELVLRISNRIEVARTSALCLLFPICSALVVVLDCHAVSMIYGRRMIRVVERFCVFVY